MTTTLFLFASGLAGIATYFLMKFDAMKKDKTQPCPPFLFFIGDEWAAIAVRILVVIGCLCGREYIQKLHDAGEWLALAFFCIGLMSDTVIAGLRAFTEKFMRLFIPSSKT